MFALVVVLATHNGLVIPPDMPAFASLDKCHAVAEHAIAALATMPDVIAVRYRCVVLGFPDAHPA